MKAAWSLDDEVWLRLEYATADIRDLAQRMGRSVVALQIRASRLGLGRRLPEPAPPEDLGRWTHTGVVIEETRAGVRIITHRLRG